MGVFFNSKRGVLQPQQIWAKHPDDGWKPIKKAFMRVEAGSGKWRQFWPAVKKGLLDGSSLRWLLTGETVYRDGHPRDEAARRVITSIVESSTSNEFLLLNDKSGGTEQGISSITLVPEDDSNNTWPSTAVTKQWDFGVDYNWRGKEARPNPIEGGSIFEYAPRKFALVSDNGISFVEEYDGENVPTGSYQDPNTGLIAPEPVFSPGPDNQYNHDVEAICPKNSIGGQPEWNAGTYTNGQLKWEFSAESINGYINATGENAKFGRIQAADIWGNYLFVLDGRAQALRRIDLQTRAVVTLAGDLTNQGTVGKWWTTPETLDGIGTDARFYIQRASDFTSIAFSDIAVHPSGAWALISQGPSSGNSDACLRKIYLAADGGFQENEVVTIVDYKSSANDADKDGVFTLQEFGWRGHRSKNLEFSPDGSTLYFMESGALYRIEGIDTEDPVVYRVTSSGNQGPQEDQGPGNTVFGDLVHLQLRSPSGRVFAVDDGTRNEVRILGTAESS